MTNKVWDAVVIDRNSYIDLWFDKDKQDVISSVDGVSSVYVHGTETKYTVYLDPRYYKNDTVIRVLDRLGDSINKKYLTVNWEQ